MIWIVLGGAWGVWKEFSEAIRDLPSFKTIATNDAGVVAPARIEAWATLHPEKFNAWRARRAEYGNTDYRSFTIHTTPKGDNDCEIVRERWPGSSGLFAAQIALQVFDASGVILCGCPLTPEGRHFFDREHLFTDVENYRKGFQAALPVIKPSVRSMSGWTAELLGRPTAEWLSDRAKAQATN